jgi:hypothetical protein
MLGGIGSILAVLGAAALLSAEINGRRREAARYAEERREQAIEQRDREQRQRDSDTSLARLIIAELVDEIQPNPDDPERSYSLHINVSNESNAFVFDVVVRIPGHDQRKVIHYIRPGQSEKTEFRGVPGDYVVRHVSRGGPSTPYQLRVVLEFTDPSGRRWRRRGWEQPRQLPDALADSSLYESLPPFSFGSHPYDALVDKLGIEVIDRNLDPDSH